MTLEEQKRLYELVQNPPPGSKIEAEKQYGVDLSLLLRRLAMTPTQRAQALESALELAEELQGAAATVAPMNGLATALKALTDAKVNFVIVGGFAAAATVGSKLLRISISATSAHPRI